jgi:molecular chaperone GrpE
MSEGKATDEPTFAESNENNLSGTEDQVESTKNNAAERTCLEADLVQAQDRIADLEAGLMRAHADLQNARRRAEKDVEAAHKYALERCVHEFIPVLDGLERGLSLIPADDLNQKASREGLEMTLKLFLEALTKQGVAEIAPEGEPFSPQYHQAVGIEEKSELEPNSVVRVLQKGYVLNDRLIRPAMVIVSKLPQPKPDQLV